MPCFNGGVSEGIIYGGEDNNQLPEAGTWTLYLRKRGQQ